MRSSGELALLGIMLLSFVLPGCGTLANGRGWGQDAIYPVNFKRITRAAHNALFDLQTLIPATGALIFTINDFDERASDWAIEHTPVFGSEDNATDWSDHLKTALQAEAILTALATPSGGDPKKWAYSKLKGLSVELAGRAVTHGTTSLLKDITDRTRPDGISRDSFPSGHASGAFSYATLANRNLESIRFSEKVKLPLQVGNLCLATGVAWARVEGRRHYPSDVLAGAALGHFLSAFIHDAFLGLPEQERFGVVISPLKGGAMAQFSFYF